MPERSQCWNSASFHRIVAVVAVLAEGGGAGGGAGGGKVGPSPGGVARRRRGRDLFSARPYYHLAHVAMKSLLSFLLLLLLLLLFFTVVRTVEVLSLDNPHHHNSLFNLLFRFPQFQKKGVNHNIKGLLFHLLVSRTLAQCGFFPFLSSLVLPGVTICSGVR